MPSAFFRSLSFPRPRGFRKRKSRGRRATKEPRVQWIPGFPKPQVEEELSGGNGGDAGSDEELELGFDIKPSSSCRSHFIQPLGNLLLSGSSRNIRDPGLGSLAVLSDELLLDVFALLAAGDLAVLSMASKALYVFSTYEPLWRGLVLEDLKGDFDFTGSWRSTYRRPPPPDAAPPRCLSIAGFYSDYLFQSWLCANTEMKPEWLEIDNIERRCGITVGEFVSQFEEPNKPVLLEGCIDGWPAMAKWRHEWLVRACRDVRFSVGPVEMTMERFFMYSDSAAEERPLYLFDAKFAEKLPELGSDYEVPVYFREDLFGLLSDERPDYRWVIIGPAGSGSSFHVDPNSTSAWNAVIKGSKKWVMFPPEVVPPGVHPSPDGAEVACPVSIVEWFMNFYDSCSKWRRRPVECVCREGEVVFVPNGWWHLVVNLEDSIAITQNYVSRSNLWNVLDFLKKPNAKELVSGTEDLVNLYDKFRNAMEAAYPGTIDAITARAEEAKKSAAQEKAVDFWESVTDAKAGGGFKFCF